MAEQCGELDQRMAMSPSSTLATFIKKLDRMIFPRSCIKIYLYAGELNDPDMTSALKLETKKSVALYVTSAKKEYYAVNKEKISKLGPVSYQAIAICAAHEVRHRLQHQSHSKISYGFWAKLKKIFWAGRQLKIGKISYLNLLLIFITDKKKNEKGGNEADCRFIEDLIKQSRAADLQKIANIVMM